MSNSLMSEYCAVFNLKNFIQVLVCCKTFETLLTFLCLWNSLFDFLKLKLTVLLGVSKLIKDDKVWKLKFLKSEVNVKKFTETLSNFLICIHLVADQTDAQIYLWKKNVGDLFCNVTFT